MVVIAVQGRIFFMHLYISKQLEEQSKIVEELEKDKERQSRKIHKLEKQLLSLNHQAAHQDLGCSVDSVRIEIKHKVLWELLLLSQYITDHESCCIKIPSDLICKAQALAFAYLEAI